MAKARAADTLVLRLDKVAIRLVQRVREAVEGSIPSAKTAVFTVTAPIRLPSKTAAEIEAQIRELLARPASGAAFDGVVHGNHVRIWLVARKRGISNVVGLVHNPVADPKVLLARATTAGPAPR